MWTLRRPLSTAKVDKVKSLLAEHKFQDLRKHIFHQTFDRDETLEVLKYCPTVDHFGTSKVAWKFGTKNKQFLGMSDDFRIQFLKALTNNRDVNLLRDLRHLWAEICYESPSTPYCYGLYYSVFIHSYINLKQPIMAMEMYMKALDRLSESFPQIIASRQLPTIRLLRLLVEYEDCEGISNVINLVQQEESVKNSGKSVLTKSEWFIYMSLACSKNHYELVKTVYDGYLMKGFDHSQINDQVLFNRELVDLFKEKEIDSSIVFSVLQALSTHGDTTRALALIESFYIHRVLAGEKAFTKDIFAMVVEAYCSAEGEDIQHLEPEELKTYHDSSVERILDVIGSYIAKSTDSLSYKDISQHLSYKFMNYKVYDEHIVQDQARRQAQELASRNAQDLASESAQNSASRNARNSARASIPQESDDIATTVELKRSNRNVSVSPFGNILANLKLLSSFVTTHINYIRSQKYPTETINLFINCVLNHVGVYQNFSGVAHILTVFQRLNPNFVNDWLDNDSMDIILNSMANSSASKLSSLYLFKYLKSQRKLTHQEYYWFVCSCLRGDFHSQLSFYLYHYIKDVGTIGPKTMDLINSLPRRIRNDLNYHPQLSQLINFHDISGLEVSDPQINDSQLEHFNREYLWAIDERDSSYIKFLFQ